VRAAPASSRLAYAAAHVVADPLRASAEHLPGQIDWDATLELRRGLWNLGLGVAEAMDTAQRGMGLDWPSARELARRTLAEARSTGGRVVVGIATDQLDATCADLAVVRDAYLEQLDSVESDGGEVVVMSSRQLAAAATSPDDYHAVYGDVLRAASRPVVLHWLGEVFDPALAGYWGHADPVKAMDVVLELIGEHAGSVRGIKVSLLDAELEHEMRRRLPAGVHPLTGYDFNYVDLIAGDGRQRHFRMIGGFETGRTLVHLADLVRAADVIGLFRDPELTAERAAGYFAVHGVV
jgi:Protein of unknown function (DUF993)